MNKFARILSGLVFVFLLTSTAFSATFTVTKTTDSNDGTCDADCSLREAITAANNAAGDDIIAFDATVFGTSQTITLTLGEIVVLANGSVTINGTGADNLTISGNNASRILASSANAVVNIDGITFTAGNGVGDINTGRGGAIYNVGGTMVITNSIITGNTASAGGGLNNAASTSPSIPSHLTLDNVVISNNTSSGAAGGMQNFSTSTAIIKNSTISGNTSNTTLTGGGGAQFNGTVRITNSTFANNNAVGGSGGAIHSNGSNQIITNSTFSGNTSTDDGGGIHRGTTNVNLFIRNTIIAGNNGTAASPDITTNAGGSISSQGNNIIGNVGTSTGWLMSDLLNTNPMLNPLADNGGLGMTFLPMPGSSAIDAGQNCVLDLTCSANNPPEAVTTDQRGVSRPQGAAVDIGSVEVASMVSNATVSGRVLTPGGYGAFRVLVTISDTNGVIQTAPTNNFGYFTFTEIPTGQMYTIDASAKPYSFTPQEITVNGDVTGVVITATAENLKE